MLLGGFVISACVAPVKVPLVVIELGAVDSDLIREGNIVKPVIMLRVVCFEFDLRVDSLGIFGIAVAVEVPETARISNGAVISTPPFPI